MFSTAPPGYPKTTSTPRSSSDLTKISAPVIFTASSLRLLRRHGAGARRRHRLRVPREVPGADLRRGRLPASFPFRDLGGGDLQREAPPRDVQRDPVPVPHEGDRPPLHRLGRDMPDAGSVGPTGKTPVGDQRHLRPQPHPHDRGGGGEHLAPPPGPPPGPPPPPPPPGGGGGGGAPPPPPRPPPGAPPPRPPPPGPGGGGGGGGGVGR